MDEFLSTLGDRVPSLLLHSCCGPCSSYVLEYLSEYFNITVFFYNPNIHPADEYYKRLETQKKLIDSIKYKHTVELMEGSYIPKDYFNAVKGLENEPEGGKRCDICFDMRLKKTAETAYQNGFDMYATTLTVSPHKNALLINEIGSRYNNYLPSDFKKREGYKRSIILSKEYGLYRQNYCGCNLGK